MTVYKFMCLALALCDIATVARADFERPTSNYGPQKSSKDLSTFCPLGSLAVHDLLKSLGSKKTIETLEFIVEDVARKADDLRAAYRIKWYQYQHHVLKTNYPGTGTTTRYDFLVRWALRKQKEIREWLAKEGMEAEVEALCETVPSLVDELSRELRTRSSLRDLKALEHCRLVQVLPSFSDTCEYLNQKQDDMFRDF